MNINGHLTVMEVFTLTKINKDLLCLLMNSAGFFFFFHYLLTSYPDHYSPNPVPNGLMATNTYQHCTLYLPYSFCVSLAHSRGGRGEL